jgi:hypothetical protein
MGDTSTGATAHAGEDREALEGELAHVQRELAGLIDEAHRWQFSWGRLRITATPSQQTLFRLFAGFHVATGLGGVVLILKGSGRAADLGIALVVGALFGIGAFMAEVWGRTVDKTAWMFDILYGERKRERFRELYVREQMLADRLEALDPYEPGD